MAKVKLTPATQTAIDKYMKGDALFPDEKLAVSRYIESLQFTNPAGWSENDKALMQKGYGSVIAPPTTSPTGPSTPPVYTPTPTPVAKPDPYSQYPTTPPPTDPRPTGPTDRMPIVMPSQPPTVPQVNPGLVSPAVDTGSGLQQLLTAPSPTQTIQTPNGGLELGPEVGGRDEGKLLAEAELQKALRQQVLDQQGSARTQMLNDLSGVLQRQQMGMLNDRMPGIYEDLNKRGLLRSSALGEKVGLEASNLARQTSEQLAQQGISDREATLSGLSNIEEQYLSGRGSALQRRISLEDYAKQLDDAKRMGVAAMPSSPSGKAGVGNAISGGMGGASVASAAGKGPAGAAATIGAGAIGGLLH